MHLKRLFVTITVCVAFTWNCYGQFESVSSGAYLSHIYFKDNIPIGKGDFNFVPKKNHYNMELYSVRDDANLIGRRELRDKIWAIYADSCLYLNLTRLQIGIGYIKISDPEKYSYFRSAPLLSPEQEKRLYISGMLFSVPGAMVTKARIDKENRNKVHYILNVSTGIVNPLNKTYLLRVLASYPDLLYCYRNDDMDDFEVQMRYIEILNRMEDPLLSSATLNATSGPLLVK